MTPRIVQVATRVLEVPLSRPWGPDVGELRVVAVEVRCDDGVTGHGFAWTPTIGGSAVAAFLADELAPWWTGREADPARWPDAWAHVHEAGGGGITTIALAGIDLALWDARARRAGVGIADLLGRRHAELPVYGSGVNLHYSIEDLRAQVERWVEAGHRAVKVKVGKPDLGEDVDRMAAVRDILGPDRDLLIDANQRWDLDRAGRALEALSAFRPAWVEEPLRADDLAAHRELRRRTDLRIAVGENLHTIHRFREVLDSGVADVVQPNIVRVGGITPFLAIAELARERAVELAPHLLPELSAQVAFALPAACWVEDVEDARFAELGVLAESPRLEFADGLVRGGSPAGLGIRFRTQEDR